MTDRAGRRPVGAVATMFTAVTVAALLPLLGSRRFYLAGDSVASWLPIGRRIGELLRGGDSHLMDPDLWRGGNFVAEAGYGLWNPIVLLLDVTVLQLDDIEIAATVVKLVYFLILSGGAYLLAREYGATAWASALAGVAVPLAGFTFYVDAATWTPNLASFAFAPYVWVGARRLARGDGQPMWVIVAGALCVSAGNPYSNAVVGVIVIAVAVEAWLDRSATDDHLLALGLSLVAVACIAVFVYLPFRLTADVGFRETGVFNDEHFAPGLNHLLGVSSPTVTPYVRNFGRDVLDFPATYLAWFVLPLAPWLRWRDLLAGWRRFAALGIVGATFLVLSLGPSHFWFFRWPIRLVPYAFLPVVIASSVAISQGVVVRPTRQRVGATFALVGFPTYLAWADTPDLARWHLGGAALVAVAVAVTVRLADHPRRLGPVMVAATVVVLAFQLQWRPTNPNFRDYAVPASADFIEDRFGARLTGTVLQVGGFDAIPGSERNEAGAYRDLAIGSVHAIGGVSSLSTYSGVGFTTHDAALCLRFDGSTCPDAWARLWATPEGERRPLADLLALDTVVVQRTSIDTAGSPTPSGWAQFETTPHAVVWKRVEPRAWPVGRLTDVDGPIEVVTSTAEGPHREVVEVRRGAGGSARLTFARLAWPGYTATHEGRPLLVGGGTAGLLTVTVPDDVDSGTIVVEWTPPMWGPSLGVLGIGLVGGLATQVWWWRRRGGAPTVDATDDDPAPTPAEAAR